jgi:hypothetical protein
VMKDPGPEGLFADADTGFIGGDGRAGQQALLDPVHLASNELSDVFGGRFSFSRNAGGSASKAATRATRAGRSESAMR